MRIFLIIVAMVMLMVVVPMCFYTVDAAEYAYVTVLGRHQATLDGKEDAQAGLHVGWPWPIRLVQRLDRRLQYFDLRSIEQLTRDPKGTVDKTLTVEAFVCWRIPDAAAVGRFIPSLGTPEQARNILENPVIDQLRTILGTMEMDDLVNTDRARVEKKMAELRDKVKKALEKSFHEKYGVELVDVRLRRFNYAGETRESIFSRIRTERERKVAKFKSDGDLLAGNIRSDAEKMERTLLANARAEEEKLKGEAEAKAMLIRNEAFSKDPEFYAFLKKMDKLQSILGDSKTLLLLSTHHPIFELLGNPPRPNGTAPALNQGEKK